MGNANLKKIVLDSYKQSINQYQLNKKLDSNWTSDKVKFTQHPPSAHATTEIRGQYRKGKISKNSSND